MVSTGSVAGRRPRGRRRCRRAGAGGRIRPGRVARMVNGNSTVNLAGYFVAVGAALIRRVTIRLDGELRHVIADGVLARSMRCPVPAEQRGRRRPSATEAEHSRSSNRAPSRSEPPDRLKYLRLARATTSDRHRADLRKHAIERWAGAGSNRRPSAFQEPARRFRQPPALLLCRSARCEQRPRPGTVR